MEGKAVLFKRFADIDSIDLEVNTEDPDESSTAWKFLGKGWGGINLEDIKAPECFIIEQRLRDSSTFRCSMTTSTAPRSSRRPDCSTRSPDGAKSRTQDRLQRRGRGRYRVPRTPRSHRFQTREPGPVRHQGGDLQGRTKA